MADVNIQQTPSSGESRSGGSGAVWAVVVVILLLVIGWFIFNGGFSTRRTTNVNVNNGHSCHRDFAHGCRPILVAPDDARNAAIAAS